MYRIIIADRPTLLQLLFKACFRRLWLLIWIQRCHALYSYSCWCQPCQQIYMCLLSFRMMLVPRWTQGIKCCISKCSMESAICYAYDTEVSPAGGFYLPWHSIQRRCFTVGGEQLRRVARMDQLHKTLYFIISIILLCCSIFCGLCCR